MRLSFLGRRARWATGIFVMSAIACVLYAVIRPAEPARPALVTVARADITATVQATGEIVPHREVEVGTLANGQLQKLHVRLGTRVTPGQRLADIDPTLTRYAVHQAAARMAAVTAERRREALLRDWHARTRARAWSVRQAKAGSAAEWDKAETTWAMQVARVRELDATLRQARIEWDMAKARLAHTRITAPIRGEVTSLRILEGQTVVAAQTAQVILVLADPSVMTVRAQISEADVARVRAGQTARFAALGDGSRWREAMVREVEPAPRWKKDSSGVAVYYNALFDVPNTDGHLRSMMTADVTITTAMAKSALTIPLTALASPVVADAADVVTARGGGWVRQRVRIGIVTDEAVQVLSGLDLGERVARDGFAALSYVDGRAA